jgi:hypothetical protein
VLIWVTRYVWKRVDVETVHRLDKERFNCNNIWLDGNKPDDYEKQQAQHVTSSWVDQFHRAYSVCNLDAREQRWLYRAWLIGPVTGQFPQQYTDELEALLVRPLVHTQPTILCADRECQPPSGIARDRVLPRSQKHCGIHRHLPTRARSVGSLRPRISHAVA